MDFHITNMWIATTTKYESWAYAYWATTRVCPYFHKINMVDCQPQQKMKVLYGTVFYGDVHIKRLILLKIILFAREWLQKKAGKYGIKAP